MISAKDSKTIIKNEYGKNLSALLVVDATDDVSKYVDFFVNIYKNVFICDDYDSGEFYWSNSKKNYDLVIVHINKEINEAHNLISKIREEDSSIYIIVFSSDGACSTYHESEHCYNADATLPYPFDEEFSCKFLYRFLKRISDLKDLEFYLSILEENIEPEHIEKITTKMSDASLKNIRFTQHVKITAVDFIKTLDVTIIDKVELFQDDLDGYTMALYDIEEGDSKISLERLQKVISILNEFSYIVGNMIIFPIIEETFKDLAGFLSSLDAKSFEEIEKKKFLVEALLGIGKDLELWIKTIFIDKSTNDVHYFDASFADSNIEIKALFNDDEIELNDEDELEFF